MSTVYPLTGIAGGGAGNLDGLTGYANGDFAITLHNGALLVHRVDTSLALTERVPSTITPDSGSGRWMWQVPGGLLARSRFSYNAATSIYIDAGIYPIYAAANLIMAVIPTRLTYSFTSLASSDVSYLYLDASAIAVNGHPIITTSELYDALTEPTYSSSKGGWYHPTTTDDLCINGFMSVSGSGSLREFYHLQGIMLYEDEITDLSLTDIDTTDATVTHSVPVFSEAALISVYSAAYSDSTQCQINMREYGAIDYITVHRVDGDNANLANTHMVMAIDSSQRSQIVHSVSGDHQSSVLTRGYFLGQGM